MDILCIVMDRTRTRIKVKMVFKDSHLHPLRINPALFCNN
jgi:hypothetical protein